MNKIVFLLLSIPVYLFGIELDSIPDQVFNERIHTVQIYPQYGNVQNEILPAFAKLYESNKLELHFDDVTEESYNYAAKIIHCNRDWKPSILVPTDYLDEYNEFLVNDQEQSFNTQTFYTHYKFKIPKINKSGNYGLIVYDMDTDELILCKRFVVFQKEVKITPLTTYTDLRSAYGKQSFNFNIDYTNKEYDTPADNIKVVILQNNRWDNAKYTIKPFMINESSQRLEYRLFNDSEQFFGGNEFRMFDARSTNFSGKNIAMVDENKLPHELYVQYEKSRNYHTYQDEYDINGAYLIDHYEFGDGSVNGDYTYVHFTLEYSTPGKSIFVFGGLTNWKLKKDFKLRYNEEKKRYEGRALLKQGYYNYIYVIDGKDEVKLEGTFRETENKYDVIVYYRAFGEQYDQVIGYKSVYLNRN